MNLNDLLRAKEVDPKQVLVLRHQPEIELRRVFTLVASDRPDLFNAFQRAHGVTVEKAMSRIVDSGYLASFIAHGPGKAVFVGLYKIIGAKPITLNQYWEIPENQELKTLGMRGFTGDRPSILWFDLEITNFYREWKGKMIVNWPPPERSWWRYAARNEIPIHAVLEESALDVAMMHWSELDLTWSQLQVLPERWKHKLSEWRAIYYIFDTSDRKGYVGSAYGANNLLGRWLQYSATGHGGNRLLRQRNA